MIHSPPRLFGADTKTKYLIGVAMHGPITGRALGRKLRFDCGRLPGLYREFSRCGVVRRQGRLLEIDPAFPAYAELMVLLRALGGERVIVVPDTSVKAPWPKGFTLFGSAQRSRVIAALALLGSSSIGTLCTVASCSRATVRSVIDHFVRDGILTTKREAPEIVIDFDERFTHRGLLIELLKKMAECTPVIGHRATLAREHVAPRREVRANEEPACLPFGTRVQSAVLLAIAARPATTRSIADATGLSKHTVRATIDALESYDLIVTTVDGQGHGSARWAAANEAHPIAKALKSYAKPLAPPSGKRELPPHGLRTTAPVRSSELPGARELRTDVLLDVFEHGSSSPTAVSKRLGISRRAVETWLLDLDSAGLVRYGERHGRMTVELAVTESRAFHFMALLSATRNFRKRRRRGDRRDRT